MAASHPSRAPPAGQIGHALSPLSDTGLTKRECSIKIKEMVVKQLLQALVSLLLWNNRQLNLGKKLRYRKGKREC
jgi:hypothetical protein